MQEGIRQRLAELIDPGVWHAREQDQVTIGAQWDFHDRRRSSLDAADRVLADGGAHYCTCRPEEGRA